MKQQIAKISACSKESLETKVKMTLSNLNQNLALWSFNTGGGSSVTEPKSGQLVSRDLGVAVKQVKKH